MLQDLESRQNPQAEAAQKKSVYEDLKPLSRVSSSRAPSRRLTMLLAAVAGVGAGVYAWPPWGDRLVSSLFPDQVVTQAPPPKLAPVPAPVPATVAIATQTTEVETPPAPPALATDKAAETPVKAAPSQVAASVATKAGKTGTVPAPAVPPAKSKAAAAEAGYWTVSRGETLYSISTQTGVDPWNLSNWNKLGRGHVIHSGQRLRLTAPATTAAKAETRQAKEEKASPAEKQKTIVASTGTPSEQKSESKATPATAPSSREIQTGNAVMDKKIKPLSSDEKAESEYRRAADLLQKGHWREAQQLLEQGVAKLPAYYPFAQLLARIYVEHGADQKALTVMEASRRAGAENPDYVAFLAALYQRAGKHAEAVKTYSEAVTLNPQEGRWWLGMGISLEAGQDWNAAAAAYQRAIESGLLEDNLLKYARQRLAVVKAK